MSTFVDCPYCESPAFVDETLSQPVEYKVVCDECEMSGPVKESEELALAAWFDICAWRDAWRAS